MPGRASAAEGGAARRRVAAAMLWVWDVIHVLLAVGALVAVLRKVDILWVVSAGAALSIGLIS